MDIGPWTAQKDKEPTEERRTESRERGSWVNSQQLQHREVNTSNLTHTLIYILLSAMKKKLGPLCVSELNNDDFDKCVNVQ